MGSEIFGNGTPFKLIQISNFSQGVTLRKVDKSCIYKHKFIHGVSGRAGLCIAQQIFRSIFSTYVWGILTPGSTEKHDTWKLLAKNHWNATSQDSQRKGSSREQYFYLILVQSHKHCLLNGSFQQNANEFCFIGIFLLA